MHHADPTWLIHTRRVIVIHEYSAGEVLTRAAFMHHEDNGHGTLKYYAVVKGLNCFFWRTETQQKVIDVDAAFSNDRSGTVTSWQQTHDKSIVRRSPGCCFSTKYGAPYFTKLT